MIKLPVREYIYTIPDRTWFVEIKNFLLICSSGVKAFGAHRKCEPLRIMTDVLSFQPYLFMAKSVAIIESSYSGNSKEHILAVSFIFPIVQIRDLLSVMSVRVTL